MARLAIFLSLIGAALLLSTSFAETPVFTPWSGDYIRHGRVRVTDGSGLLAQGKVKIHFRSQHGGQKARIRLRGQLRISQARRTFSTIIVLGRDGLSAVSNLAPGIDDGHQAKSGDFTANASRITASIPFQIGTSIGTAEFTFALRGRRLTVTETLQATSLTSPVIWRFVAAKPR